MKQGNAYFQKLQHYEDNTQYQLCYYVFDVLSLNGKLTYELPLIARKQLLKKLLEKKTIIRYSYHVIENGKAIFARPKHLTCKVLLLKSQTALTSPG